MTTSPNNAAPGAPSGDPPAQPEESGEVIVPRSRRTSPVRAARLREPIGLVVGLAVLVILGLKLAPANSLELEYAVSLALFAVATNLLLGFGGLVSFGQGVFYAVGAYVVSLGWMHHSLTFTEAMLVAPVAGAAVALPLGLLALRTRRLYFALLTLTFSQLAYVILENQAGVTGGSNGVFGSMLPNWLLGSRGSFFFVLAVTALSIGILWKITRSPFGMVLRAIRDNRERVEALGVNVFAHELVAFVLSGFFCAIAGSLFVVYSQSSYPELAVWTNSGIPIFMAVIGGMYTFFGPVLGAFVYELSNHYLIEHTQDWQIVLGVVLLVIVLLRPDGLAGTLHAIGARIRRRRDAATSDVAARRKLDGDL